MCGRYVVARATSDLVAMFDVDLPADDLPEPDWNVAPTKQVPIVVDSTKDGPPERRLESARWGLVPSWAKDESIGSKAFNARSETAAEKPMFRDAVAGRRVLLPADGYYEWQRHGEPGAEQRTTPLYIHPSDGGVLAFAGLYAWHRRADGSWLLSASILTADSIGQLADVHDRMPLILGAELWDAWLDPDEVGDEALLGAVVEQAAELVPSLAMHEVDARVGNVRENGHALTLPVDDASSR